MKKDTTKEQVLLLRYMTLLVLLVSVLAMLSLLLLSRPYWKNTTVVEIQESSLSPKKKDTSPDKEFITDTYQLLPFSENNEGKLAEYGHKLITETYAYIGPDTQTPITGNRLACSSCHLNGGTKPYAAPYIGLAGFFPTYIARENKIESLEERINGCFERSMNGRAIDVNSQEMRAIMTYIKHISKETPVGNRIKGQGFVDIKVPDRAADPAKGALVYQQHCVSCHGTEGQGKKGENGSRAGGYIFPPLWGNDSFNDGAGMARLLTAAKFIKGNMPLGATHSNPILADEEAYDVAAYINSFGRATKAHKEKDYPNLAKKPKDCPYPPYTDSIPHKQHKYGPFNFGK